MSGGELPAAVSLATMSKRRPGRSWILPTNYHLWVHDAPNEAAHKLILAALDLSQMPDPPKAEPIPLRSTG